MSITASSPSLYPTISSATERSPPPALPSPSPSSTSDVSHFLSVIASGRLLSESTIQWLCAQSTDLLMAEPNVLSLSSPLSVVGDVHGHYTDVMANLFPAGGDPAVTRYLFLGDIVDRGAYSLEMILTLLLLKLRRPGELLLLRGNHESRRVSASYGFYDECIRKYGTPSVWTMLTDVFDFLPLAAVIDERVFAVHGGLSPFLPTLADISRIDRQREIPHDSDPLSDLVWSDPLDDDDCSEAAAGSQWVVSPRGGGWLFGEVEAQRFLHRNALQLIVRSHQLCKDGYKRQFHDTLLTVWSAPNYWSPTHRLHECVPRYPASLTPSPLCCLCLSATGVGTRLLSVCCLHLVSRMSCASSTKRPIKRRRPSMPWQIISCEERNMK